MKWGARLRVSQARLFLLVLNNVKVLRCKYYYAKLSVSRFDIQGDIILAIIVKT